MLLFLTGSSGGCVVASCVVASADAKLSELLSLLENKCYFLDCYERFEAEQVAQLSRDFKWRSSLDLM